MKYCCSYILFSKLATVTQLNAEKTLFVDIFSTFGVILVRTLKVEIILT